MKKTKIIMGMPITVCVLDKKASKSDFSEIFDYFKYVDKKFSTYKKDSEISLFNKGKITKKNFTADMKTVFRLADKTLKETNGYFNILHNGKYDPSGVVKGWAILNAFHILKSKGFKNFYIDCGGDIQVFGKNKNEKAWKIGIKNPFNQKQNVKILYIINKGVATSGNYIRGNHIYNPISNTFPDKIVSITIIGPNVLEADRFATAAFAMNEKGIEFIENLKGFEGYMIDKNAVVTMTSGFEKYTKKI